MSDSVATRWTVAYQAPLSVGFSRQEYWSGLLFPSNSCLLHLLHWQADSLPLSHQGSPSCSFHQNKFNIEPQVQSPGQEDPLDKEMTTHFSILAWRVPWTEELGGLQFMGNKESDMI